MNIVGIDPSLVSTAIVLNGKLYNYVPESHAHNKSGMKKWYKDTEHLVNYRFFNQPKFDSYEEEQIKKLISYQEIVKMIMKDITDNVDFDEPIKIGIEGYSYSSLFGPLVDLVTFGTLLRTELSKITPDILIITPSTLKLETCKMVYKPIEIIKGKRNPKIVYEHRNNEGIAGGNFTKHDIYKALIESSFSSDWINYLRSVKNEILKRKNIPKPHDDINDGVSIYLYIKGKLNGQK